VRVTLVSTLPRGGPVEQALLLADELGRSGARVRAVVSHEPVAERFAAAGSSVALVPSESWYEPRVAGRLWRAAGSPDVVHAHDRRAALWLRLLPRPSRATARVHTVHGIADAFLPEAARPHPPRPRDRVAYLALEPLLARRVEAMIVPSEAVARDLIDRFRYPAGRVSVVPNGIALPPMRPINPGGCVATLTVFERYKALDVYLEAVARLAPRRPDVRFAMFGTGSQAEALAAQAHRLGIEQRLETPGFVRAADALADMRVFVMSSRWENAPMALLEAMAAGIPVVATDVYGVPEIAAPGTAQLVPPDDPGALAAAIERLLDDPALAERQVAAARERVERHFSARTNAERVLEVYRRAIAARARGSATARGSAAARGSAP
jgi:glycosyltransferase involved in cell wall biosynthesis